MSTSARKNFFDDDATKRIVRSVKKTEGDRPYRRGAGFNDAPIDGEGGGQTTIYLLRADGGLPGGDGNFCTLTYSGWNVGDDPDNDPPIFVEAELHGQGNGWRNLPTELSPATEGEGYFDSDGRFILLEPYEGPASYLQCNDP